MKNFTHFRAHINDSAVHRITILIFFNDKITVRWNCPTNWNEKYSFLF